MKQHIWKQEYGGSLPLRRRLQFQFGYWLASCVGVPCEMFGVITLGFLRCDLHHWLAEKVYHKERHSNWCHSQAERDQERDEG